MGGLARLGVDVRPLDAELPRPLRVGCRAWLAARGHLDDRWQRSPEAIGTTELWCRVRLGLPPARQASAWVQIGSELGAPLRGRYVTFDDMTVAQARRLPNPYFDRVPARSFEAWDARQRQLFARAHACCVASHWAADSVVRDYGIDPTRVHVVGIGANTEVPPADRDWSLPRFLFLGRDWQRKNGPAVVEAFCRLRSETGAATLDLVGEHPRVDVPGVTGHGALDQADPGDRAQLAMLLQRATCLVVPSVSEPFGIAYLEAATAGVASIGTTVGGAAEPIGEGGLLVNPADELAILNAMRRLCDPATAEKLGGLARQRSTLFTWRRVAERVVRALDAGLAPLGGLAEFLEAP
jgi:glycosyltransferase involved in cell wall biosynthesis